MTTTSFPRLLALRGTTWKVLRAHSTARDAATVRTPRCAPFCPSSLSCWSRPVLLFAHHPRALHCASLRFSSPPPPPPSTAPSASPPADNASTPAFPVAGRLREEKRPPIRVRLRTFVQDGRPRWYNYLLLGLAGCASYLVFSVSAELMVFLDSIHHVHSLEYAYVSGAVVLACALGFFSAARRSLPVRLQPLYRLALRRVSKDARVQQLLGGKRLRFGPTAGTAPSPSTSTSSTSSPSPSTPSAAAASNLSSPADEPVVPSIQPGGFRLVTTLPGGPRWRAEPRVVYWGWERYWRPRRAQFVVTVEGDEGHGVVLAQLDHKVDERKIIQWLSVESIVSTQPSSATSNTHRQRVVIEQHGGAWSTDANGSSARL